MFTRLALSGTLLGRCLMRTLWPAFLVACLVEAIMFSLFDPHEMLYFGAPVELSRTAVYTMGFFLLWGMGAASSALTLLFEGNAAERPDRRFGSMAAEAAESGPGARGAQGDDRLRP